MWTIEQLGKATWQQSGSSWNFNASGGTAGIRVEPDSPQRSPIVRFEAVESDRMPSADEQFVRGDTWHVNYPQGDHSYALRCVMRPIETTAQRLVLELTVSIQTSLLDTHPKIDIAIACDRRKTLEPAGATGTSPITLAECDAGSTAVLLGPHDSPFTTDHSDEGTLRLRLFGDFLEKGVIRRARPWLVIDRSQPVDESHLRSYWKQLNESPIPLT